MTKLRQCKILKVIAGVNCDINSFSLCLSDDPTQVGKGFAVITVLDINDNPPVFAIEYETLLCENAAPGQVRN